MFLLLLNSSSNLKTIVESLTSKLNSKEALSLKKKRHLISLADYSGEEIDFVVSVAQIFKELSKQRALPIDLLKGKHVALAFFENSTRTKTSFDIAATNLGAHVVDLNISTSSTAKGESLGDTASTLDAMGTNAIIQRHSQSGSLAGLNDYVSNSLSLINAGEGKETHPTQALLDYFTMLEYVDSIKGKKITIFGDTKYSRVARSNVRLLSKMGADIHIASPENLLARDLESLGVKTHLDLNQSLEDCDFIMALRMQFERQEKDLSIDRQEYISRYQLTHEHLKKAKRGVKLLHPGPVNRDLEITSELMDDLSYSVIKEQVSNGIFVRMAVLAILLNDQER